MVAVSTSETLVNIRETSWCIVPEDCDLSTCSHANLKFHGIYHQLDIVVCARCTQPVYRFTTNVVVEESASLQSSPCPLSFKT
jgi:hypothetical protein